MNTPFIKLPFDLDAHDTYIKYKSMLESINNPDKNRLIEGLDINYNALLEKKGWLDKEEKLLKPEEWIKRRYDLIVTPTDIDAFIYWLPKFLLTINPYELPIILDDMYTSEKYGNKEEFFINIFNGRILTLLINESQIFDIKECVETVREWVRTEKSKIRSGVKNENEQTHESESDDVDDRINLELTYNEVLEYFKHLKEFDKDAFTNDSIKNLILSNFKTTENPSLEKRNRVKIVSNKRIKETIKYFVYEFYRYVDNSRLRNKVFDYYAFIYNNFSIFNIKDLEKGDHFKNFRKKLSYKPKNYPFDARSGKIKKIDPKALQK